MTDSAGTARDINQLQQRFVDPPAAARIMMRWWWFGPAVTHQQLEREMRLMDEGGIGGFEVQPTYPLALDNAAKGIKNLPFMSPEFLDALAFTARKAKELGLRMDLTLGSSWPYGGAQFSIDENAGQLHFARTAISVGQTSVSVPTDGNRGQVFAAFLGPMKTTLDGQATYQEVLIRDGEAQFPSDLQGATQVTFFYSGQTGKLVARPALGAEGYAIDHFNTAVIEKFIREIAEPAIAACGNDPPYAVFCDSLEISGHDWTVDFLEQFRRRRGYDLRPHLPALVDSLGESEKVRHDWGKTLTELFNENFISAFRALAQKYHSRFRIQAYGAPPAALHSYAFADMIEGEGYDWKNFDETRWATSASHLLGHTLASSEAWTWLHSPVFRATPLDMKAEAHLHFLQGVNQLVGHGWPYTHPSVGYPGWQFYAAAVFNDKNPWWIVMPEVTKYLQRISAMLREGTPANDVAVYLSNSDAWSAFTPGHVEMNAIVGKQLAGSVVSELLDAGYNLDFFDDGLLELRGKVEQGELCFGDLKYKVVVLANVRQIPPATMRMLEQFALQGGHVVAVGTIPSRVPGMVATDSDQQSVQQVAARLFEQENSLGRFVENAQHLGATISERLQPDVSFEPAAPEIGFVHRHLDCAEVYFLANTSNAGQRATGSFRVEGLQAEWWNPTSGQVEPARILARSPGRTTVEVNLAPYDARLLVFTRRDLPAEKVQGLLERSTVLDLSTDWSVRFGTATPVQMDMLRSWIESDATRFYSGVATYEKQIQISETWLADGVQLALDFGEVTPTAQLERKVSIGEDRDTHEEIESQGMRAQCEGSVREAAIVFVNGSRVGSVWCPPYTLDLTGHLKSGSNHLRIDVANLAVNYMAGRPEPDLTELRAVFGNRFQPQDLDQIRPLPAGLLGPIKLIASRPISKT